MKCNFRTVANIIFIDILYDYRNFIEVYPFNYKQFKSATRTPQRFEICNGIIKNLIPLPAQALFSRQFFPVNFKLHAEELMKSASEFLFEHFEETRRLKLSLKYIAGYPDNSIDDSFLSKVYQNLTLNGNESLLETYIELGKFKKFLNLVELDQDEVETLKISQHVDRNVFGCSVIKKKILCKTSFI